MKECQHEIGEIDSVFDEIEGTIILYVGCKNCGLPGMVKIETEDVEWDIQ